jgi:hypothetical protein
LPTRAICVSVSFCHVLSSGSLDLLRRAQRPRARTSGFQGVIFVFGKSNSYFVLQN